MSGPVIGKSKEEEIQMLLLVDVSGCSLSSSFALWASLVIISSRLHFFARLSLFLIPFVFFLMAHLSRLIILINYARITFLSPFILLTRGCH